MWLRGSPDGGDGTKYPGGISGDGYSSWVPIGSSLNSCACVITVLPSFAARELRKVMVVDEVGLNSKWLRRTVLRVLRFKKIALPSMLSTCKRLMQSSVRDTLTELDVSAVDTVADSPKAKRKSV